MINSENYMTIQGWMRTELNLKGNDLLIYAIIYGYSQAEGTRFTGSLQYLADWCGATKQGVLKNLKNLIEKGLIQRVENVKNGVKFVEYYTTEFNTPLNSVVYPIKHSLTNNIDNTIDNNLENKVFISKDINTTKPRTSRYTQWMVLINERSEDESIRKLLTEWLEMVLEKYKDTGKQLYKNVLKGKLKMLDEIPMDDWKESIEYSIQKGYEGFYPVKKRNERRSDNAQSNRPDAEYNKREEEWRKEMERNGKKIKF